MTTGNDDIHALPGYRPAGASPCKTAIMEAPQRDGAVYGEEYSGLDGARIAEALSRDPEEAARLARELKA